MIHEGGLPITADPLPVPSAVHVVPVLFVQRPFVATPAITDEDPGTDERSVRFPHSDDRPARVPVAFCQVTDCASVRSRVASASAEITVMRIVHENFLRIWL